MSHYPDYKKYTAAIKERSSKRYILGLIARWLQYRKYKKARRIARKNGAKIGKESVLSLALAKRANSNLTVGDFCSIHTDELDLRRPITIGNHVIIGSGVKVFTLSHNIDSPEWEHMDYGGCIIEDYVWLATDVFVLPNCTYISRGTVCGAGSVVVKNVDEELSVVGGNPARFLRKRACVHSEHVVPSNLGGDYKMYKYCRNK